jgi:uncharacterized protein (DUF2267 family)
MEHDAFVGRVQQRARLASRGDAEAAIRATLETLAERLDPGLAENLASQLPPEIGGYLLTADLFERLSADDFIDRVTFREGVDRPDAVFHIRAVLEVMEEATTGIIDKVRLTLPDEFQPFFAGSQGRMPSRD